MAFLGKKKKIEEFDTSSVDDEFEDFGSEVDGMKPGEYDQTYDYYETGIGNQSEVVKLWLDTEPYLNTIKLSLLNQEIQRVKIVDKHGNERSEVRTRKINESLEPLANDLGISQIMSELRVFLSSPLVQGNLTEDRYKDFMMGYCRQVNIMLFSNLIHWGIKDQDAQGIYHKVTDSVALFLTRPIHNLERTRDKSTPDNSKRDDLGMIESLMQKRKNKKYGVGG